MVNASSTHITETGAPSLPMTGNAAQANTGTDWSALRQQSATLAPLGPSPFLPTRRLQSSHASAEKTILHPAEPTNTPTLRAILTGPDMRLAWIGSHLVQTGEKVQGMLVVRIAENSVDLRQGGRNVRIFLDPPRRQGSTP